MNKQIIVLGMGRCGTSMICGVLDKIGVKMKRSPLMEPKLEGKNVYGYWDNGSFHKKFYSKDPLVIRKVIDKEKIRTGIWGWKHHSSLKHIDELLKLSNPMFIICERGLRQQAESFRHHVRGRNITIEAMEKEIVEHNVFLDKVVKEYKLNVLRIKFENVILHPEKECRKIAGFVGLALNQKAINSINKDYPLFNK